MQKKNPLLAIGIIVFVVVIIAFVLLFGRGFKGVSNTAKSGIVGTIVLKQDGTSFSLDSTGNAIWSTDGNTRSALWSSDKTNSFFAYYDSNWASKATIVAGSATVNGSNDELAKAVIDEGSGGGGTGGGDIGQYFGTPTPTPTGSGSGGGGAGGGTGDSGGDNGAPSWCKHWRLSYCSDPPPDTTIPSPTSTPITGQATPLPPDCNNAGNQQTGRTVIGNELCLTSPTPVATP